MIKNKKDIIGYAIIITSVISMIIGFVVFMLEMKNIMVTIDDPIAFDAFNEIRSLLTWLVIFSSISILLIIGAVCFFTVTRSRRDNEALHKSEYINAVQGALITAHNNPDFVHQALKIISNEVNAETVLLLTFNNKIISDAYYWPSKDRVAAMALMGLEISDVFPTLFDALSSNESMFIDDKIIKEQLSERSQMLFSELDVSNMLIVPIMDNAGMLKAAIATVNIPPEEKRPEMLRCVTQDFFLAIANLESYNIIKNMSELDYLTGVNNRNRYEADIVKYSTDASAETLWCMFIDANGLHDLNNRHGHKAGDRMLCTVADSIKRIFGSKYTYRVGGDEFVAFKTDSNHGAFMVYKQKLIDELAEYGYSVSIGFASVKIDENQVFDVDKAVTSAEKYMYREKHEYYEKNGISADREQGISFAKRD